ncbi:MAG: hypothetical protein QOC80_611 [Frankiaceae bacterium]|nr:hypothetical protein [Frankiaceae bacterium]
MKRPTSGSMQIGDLSVSTASPDVVLLLQHAAAPPHDEEYREQAAAVAAFVAASTDPGAAPEAPVPDNPAAQVPAPRRAATVRGIRVAAAGLLASVVLGGGLAAADVLPAPAQRFVSSVLGSVGIPVPSPDDRSSAERPAPSPSPVDNEIPAGPEQSATGVGSPSGLPEAPGRPLPGAGTPATDDPARGSSRLTPSGAAEQPRPTSRGAGTATGGSSRSAPHSSNAQNGNGAAVGKPGTSAHPGATGKQQGSGRAKATSRNPPGQSKQASKAPAKSHAR